MLTDKGENIRESIGIYGLSRHPCDRYPVRAGYYNALCWT